MRVDLQTQTHYSDGQLSPTKLVQLAARHRIATLAITDHDSFAGIEEAQRAGKRFGVTIIPGIELYATFRGHEVHILGYDVDVQNGPLLSYLRTVQAQHRVWLERVCEKLSHAHFVVPGQKLHNSPTELMGFQELISTLLASPKNLRRVQRDLHAPTPDLFAVINKYFVRGGIAYVQLPEKQLPALRAIAMIVHAGGQPVLAHPGQTLRFSDDHLIAELAQSGLRGVEAVTPHHTWHQVLHYQRVAARNHLYVTAGSDFHEVLRDPIYIYKSRWDYFVPQLPRLPWKRPRR